MLAAKPHGVTLSGAAKAHPVNAVHTDETLSTARSLSIERTVRQLRETVSIRMTKFFGSVHGDLFSVHHEVKK